ncbi:hypothetical protein [Pseudanabaena yagii]|uniref:Uncharacterized protein n=1 Tax=Pseudanabaena yagii GIHE-NHR1 TaxID=2722753 RepID=A0ABX1LRA0_9CYAN|nr:hypothetical protein [Pseudanabaena yagii]NMF58653.1 hypothetical protein [Pseudanabaena yagii GIHE-NHR1]
MPRTNSSNINEIKFDDQKGVQAQTFVYWSKRYRKDVLQMSFESFGNYLTSFIKYLLLKYGNLLTEKDRKKCEERLDGELTEMVRCFEVEERYSERSMNQAWRKYFMLFCITGKVESDFDLFSYLNTGALHIYIMIREKWGKIFDFYG